jgi:hypothetical protein
VWNSPRNGDGFGEAIAFYCRTFDAKTAELTEGYAKLALNEPPLTVVLSENPGNACTVNYLGVEVELSALGAEHCQAPMRPPPIPE